MRTSFYARTQQAWPTHALHTGALFCGGGGERMVGYDLEAEPVNRPAGFLASEGGFDHEL